MDTSTGTLRTTYSSHLYSHRARQVPSEFCLKIVKHAMCRLKISANVHTKECCDSLNQYMCGACILLYYVHGNSVCCILLVHCMQFSSSSCIST